MKQFFCIVVALAASAALLFLVSAPINNVHSTEEGSGASHSAETTTGHGAEPDASASH